MPAERRAAMRILVLSDLHVEAADFVAPAVDADLVVLAGDVHNGAAAVHWARAAFPGHPVVQVAGNHEFYGAEFGEVAAGLRAAARGCGVHLLENAVAVVDGVRFVGCTLWTDFRIFERAGRPIRAGAPEAMAANRALIADYFAIRVGTGASQRAFDPRDAARLHQASRRWLATVLADRFDGPTVVVTHHLPSWRSVHPDYAAWITNAAFVSDLDALVERADLWIHGHTHSSHRYRIGRTPVVCNPRGYPLATAGEDPPATFENPAFDPALVLDVVRR